MTIGYDPSRTSPSESPVFLSVSAARNAAYLASAAAWMKGAESSQTWVTKGVSSVCSSGERGRRPARGSKPLDPPAYGALPCTPPGPASYAASGAARGLYEGGGFIKPHSILIYIWIITTGSENDTAK